MRVKVCGITRREDALLAARAGADFVGLIRAPSDRQVPLAVARAIVAELSPTVQPVLVFRDAALDQVWAAIAETRVRWVQLHGGESVEYLRALRTRCPGVQVIKAWEITAAPNQSPSPPRERFGRRPQDLPSDRPLSPSLEARGLHEFLRATERVDVRPAVVLLDVPKDRPHPGHECLGRVAHECRDLATEIWCAGGLTPDNLAAAVAAGPFDGVDVARGVEHSPGVKDPAAVERFVKMARAI